jgi:hypothetical protein
VNYDEIKELAKELDRPVNTLIALQDSNDPFYVMPGRMAKAEWFVELRNRLGIPTTSGASITCSSRRTHR